jgi:DNA sulfur modification protein DndB
MVGKIQGIGSRDDLRQISVRKSKRVDEKTVAAGRPEALALKIEAEEQDGWHVAKRNKKSARMAKSKPADRQLEDDIWCLFYKLEFNELNSDRQCTVAIGAESPPRQIDIFAKDDETVFMVEFTHSQETSSKSVKALVDKINGMREEVIKAIHSDYGRTPRLKVKWGIATRNIQWRSADKTRGEESGIAIITQDDIIYYNRLINYLKDAARYQFLARYLKGEGIPGLRNEVRATRGKIGDVTFYNFLISPFDLLKIS